MAALCLHEAAAAHAGSEGGEQLAAKVVPKALDVLLLLLDIQGELGGCSKRGILSKNIGQCCKL